MQKWQIKPPRLTSEKNTKTKMKKYQGPIPDSASNEGPEDEAPDSQEAKKEAKLEVKKPVLRKKPSKEINIRKTYKD